MRASRLHFPLAAALAAALLALGGCDERHERAPVHSGGVALAKLKTEVPKSVPQVTFTGADGKAHDLGEFRGHYVLLNLWATWCAPCVRELPALARLQAALPGKQLSVVPVNVGHGTAEATAAFLKDTKAGPLPVYLDTKSAFLHAFGAFGLPLTVLIDPRGREIARASGAVKWDAKESIDYFKSLKRGAEI